MVVSRHKTAGLPTGPKPEIRAWVLAVGSPFGIAGTATTGRISNIDGTHLLTDAAINHEDSGGPLLDSQGRVVGTDSARAEDADNTGIPVGLPLLCDRGLVCSKEFRKVTYSRATATKKSAYSSAFRRTKTYPCPP